MSIPSSIGVRIAFQHGAVHVGAGLAFVGVADDVFHVGGGLPGEPPFLAGGKGRAAAAAQPRLDHRVDHRLGRHLRQRPEGPAIGAAGDRFVQRHRIDRAAVPQDDLLLAAVEIQADHSGTSLEPGRPLANTCGLRRSRPTPRCGSGPRPSPAAGRRLRRSRPAIGGSSRASCCRN